jgi:hypothetical protein
MNRLGRGYSFEALRAKILFSEGAFKKELQRPKFERRIERFGREMPDFAMEFAIDMGDQQGDEVNYGVDISTLTRMIESGEL